MKDKNNWDIVIKPQSKFFDLNISGIHKYKDLIYLLVKRDFVTFYKQTILGPIWYILQPLLNTIVFTIIFGKVAKISTDGIPPFIFYMSGTIIWGYFAYCLNTTSRTFTSNADLFGKVYFPRIAVPISVVIIGLVQFVLQLSFFLCFLIYYYYNGLVVRIDFSILLLPFIVLHSALIALGFGLLLSSLTSKYRDLSFVLGFGIQLWMFATPVVYPLSIIPENYVIFAILNPMTMVLESFKFIFFHENSINFFHLFISLLCTFLILFFGLLMFNKTEKKFLDTV